MKSWIQTATFSRSKLHEGKSSMSVVTEGVYSPSASHRYGVVSWRTNLGVNPSAQNFITSFFHS
jgi:hypothetical protein